MQVRKTTTHTGTKIRTCILITSRLLYSFAIEKFIYHSFLFPQKLVESKCFLKHCNPIGDSFPQKDYFSHSVIWPSLNS